MQCFEKGLGYKRTAGLIDVPESTVRDWKRLWKAGHFSLAPLFQYKGGLSAAEQKQILSMRKNGRNIQSIAEALGYSPNRVSLFLHKTMTVASLATDR